MRYIISDGTVINSVSSGGGLYYTEVSRAWWSFTTWNPIINPSARDQEELL